MLNAHYFCRIDLAAKPVVYFVFDLTPYQYIICIDFYAAKAGNIKRKSQFLFGKGKKIINKQYWMVYTNV